MPADAEPTGPRPSGLEEEHRQVGDAQTGVAEGGLDRGVLVVGRDDLDLGDSVDLLAAIGVVARDAVVVDEAGEQGAVPLRLPGLDQDGEGGAADLDGRGGVGTRGVAEDLGLGDEREERGDPSVGLLERDEREGAVEAGGGVQVQTPTAPPTRSARAAVSRPESRQLPWAAAPSAGLFTATALPAPVCTRTVHWTSSGYVDAHVLSTRSGRPASSTVSPIHEVG